MKDSKEKEHRISNLKDMITNIKEEDENKNFDEELEEDSELIEYLNEDPTDYDNLEINDEFIYHPGSENTDAVNLEDESIDEDYIIKTPKVEESEEEDTNDEYSEDFVGEISENFDTVINAKIGGKPILAMVSSVLGIILIIISLFIFQSRADRIVDNVVAGETSFMFIIFLAIGALLLIYGIFRLWNIGNPLSHMTRIIESDDPDDKKETEKPEKKEPSPKVIPKSKIPLDKDSYKVGEFNLNDIKASLKKPTTSKKKEKVEENIDDIPPAKEKEPEKKGLTTKEIEEMEYEQVVLDNESIDDIFAEVENIDDLEIISIDSKEKKEK